ncbi:MAG: DUF1835 domain-containing protein [Paenibacillus sp.]|uniref:DUF1835 domain-containing protein n=1 Tax=Paenibacillus sp. TaxID=58172 RepID=UPI0025D0EC7E|nr:DUF1835 domain-containing protein [Paenibacillus sp.]MBR2565339.1 DUF1835 domain-containing protein [Paenibacillus sp.]
MIKSVFDLDNELQQMEEEELRSLLRELYLRTDMAMNGKHDEAHYMQFVERQHQLFSQLHLRDNVRELPDLQHAEEIHIAIGESPLGSIKVAMGEFPGREGRRFYSLNDYYAIGPLGDLTDARVMQRRHLWLLERLHISEHGSYLIQGLKQLNQIKSFLSAIREETRVILWYTNNGHERTGLLYALYLLRHRQNTIKLMDTTSLYQALFDTSEHQVLRLGELISEHLSMMWKHSMDAEPLSEEQRSLMEKEWLELSLQPGTLRIIQDDVVQSIPEDSLDEFILEQVKKLAEEHEAQQFINAARVVGEVLGNLPQAVGDSFIEYRLRQLVLQGKLDMEGNPRAMRFYRVRLATAL